VIDSGEFRKSAAGSPGEIFGSALAHAETNVLARLPFPRRRNLVLTTTLHWYTNSKVAARWNASPA
jgi:hypothetical protein